MDIDSGEHSQQPAERGQSLGALTAPHGRGERVAHGHVPLERDGDDEPARVVAEGVGDDGDEATRPVGGDQQVVACQLTQPQTHEADVQDEGVGGSEHGEVDVSRVLPHGGPREDDERQHVADGAEQEQHRGHVQLQLLVQPEVVVRHQVLLVWPHVHVVGVSVYGCIKRGE